MATQNAVNDLPWYLIQTQTASNVASLTFTTGITTAYSNFMVVWSGVVPVTNTQILEMQVSTNGGSSYIATGYTTGFNRSPYNSNTLTNNNSTTYVILSGTVANTAGIGTSGTLYCYNFNNGNTQAYSGTALYNAAGTTTIGFIGGTGPGTTTVNALQFIFASGNISTGTISLYGQQ